MSESFFEKRPLSEVVKDWKAVHDKMDSLLNKGYYSNKELNKLWKELVRLVKEIETYK